MAELQSQYNYCILNINRIPAKMRLALHTVICCCVFTTVLPLVKGATGDNTNLIKRFTAWLLNQMRKDGNSLETASEEYSDIRIGLQQHGNADNVILTSRPRRTSLGCFLPTCSYHVLIDILQQISNMQTAPTAPQSKMGSKGYGRRRRSPLDVTQPAIYRHKRTDMLAQDRLGY
ncbi:hypothetical protein PAMP_020141 [Pampus punctatissimus]